MTGNFTYGMNTVIQHAMAPPEDIPMCSMWAVTKGQVHALCSQSERCFLQRHLTLAKRKMAPMGVDLTPLWVYSHVAGVVKLEAVSLLREKNPNNSGPEIVTITTM